MSRTGAELFVDALSEYGVEYVFGNPGTTELAVVDAVGESDLDYRLALHEDVAVGMAAGYATTRRYHAHDDPSITPLGAVNLHIAPGTAHGLGNLLDLWHTRAPVLVTAGDHPLDHGHREPNLGGDMVEMTDQFTKYSARVEDVEAMPEMVRRAARTALTPPTGPVFLSLPLDVTRAETDADPEPLGQIPDAGAGDPRGVAAAVDALVAAEDAVLVVGDAVSRGGAAAEAVALAEAAGARAHGEFKAGLVGFPTDHELWGGRLPRDQERAAALLDADTVALLGTLSNTTTNPLAVEILGRGTTCVQVSPDVRELGKNYAADAAVLGDPGRVLGELAARVTERVDEAERTARSERAAATAAAATDAGIDVERAVPEDAPAATVDDLAAGLAAGAPDARVVAEAPTSTGALRSAYGFGPGDLIANRGGGLGYGLPAALGAAIAETDRAAETGATARPVVGYVGDGSYLYYPQALYSAARYDVDVTVAVVDNGSYRILKDNTLRLFGGEDADYGYTGMDFEPPVSYAENAASHGATGRRVTDPDGIETAVREAVATDGPVVLDVPVRDD